MIVFIHKKHLNIEDAKKGRIVIYYNVSDIFLGIILLALVVFFIHDYLSHSLGRRENNCFPFPSSISNVLKNNPGR